MRLSLLSFLALTACLPACGPKAPKPVTFGFAAVQCIAVREVVCVNDKDYAGAHCAQDVTMAIEAINEAIGREIFRYAGPISPDAVQDAIDKDQLPVMGAPQEYMVNFTGDPNVLAFTMPKIETMSHLGLACVAKAIIAVGPSVALRAPYETSGGPIRWDALDRAYILAHELVHALGGAHAPGRHDGGYFGSRMEPGHRRQKDFFSPADKYTLRSVYNP